jgi:lipoprotein-anchoring transpeptidase ErfK/SrfK
VGRTDSTLSTLPIPAIVAPSQPVPAIAVPAAPLASILQRLPGTSVSSISIALQAPTEVVLQATPAPAHIRAPSLAAPDQYPPARTPIVQPTAGQSIASILASKVVAVLSPSATLTKLLAAPVAAPADAVAVSSPLRSSETTTRVDARTVISVKSSERFEPLYAVPLPASGARLGPPAAADSIVVYKRERTLTLFNRGVPVRSYFVALGSKPVGDKQRAGDQRTPEGVFYINAHNPASKFHLALRISYPDDAHRTRAQALGVDPGGDIMIHGLPKEYSAAGKDHRQNDWTNGCVALSNQEIEEIWHAVPDGTPVQIKP